MYPEKVSCLANLKLTIVVYYYLIVVLLNEFLFSCLLIEIVIEITLSPWQGEMIWHNLLLLQGHLKIK